MSSITDVAKLAGVSKTLVSRVLNNQKSVSEQSRKKILAAMEELIYHPNAIARSLVLQRTNVIGVIVDTLCDPFFFDFIHGVEKEIEKSHYEVVFCSSREKAEVKKQYIDFLSQGMADGYILYGSHMRDEKLLDSLETSMTSVVVVENDVGSRNIQNVCVDNRYGSKLAVEHLIQTGVKRIYHVTGDLAVKAAIDRLEGYLETMKKYGIKVSENMVVEADFSMKSGFEAAQIILENGREQLPEAIYCGADATAIGVMSVLQDNGIGIPEDIKIVGFDNDNVQIPGRAFKGLTTIAQPMFEMGVGAARMLLEDIQTRPKEKKRKIYYPELIVRETTMG